MAQDKIIQDKGVENVIRNLFIIFASSCFVFLLFIIFFGFKIGNNESCGVNKFTTYDDLSLINSSYILNNPNSIILQEIQINKTNNIFYKFCYDLAVSNTTGLNLQIIDSNENVLATSFVINDTQTYCSLIDSEDMKNINYIGLKCLDCDTDNYIIPKQEIVGQNRKQIFINNGITKTYNDNNFNFIVYGNKSCLNLLAIFSNLFIILICMSGTALLIMLGYDVMHVKLIEETLE